MQTITNRQSVHLCFRQNGIHKKQDVSFIALLINATARVMSPADAGFLCDKVALPGAAIRETPCTEELTQMEHKMACRCDVSYRPVTCVSAPAFRY